MTSIEPHRPGDLIEIYCTGTPSNPHARKFIARMIRTYGMGEATSWSVAREAGRQSRALEFPRVRIALRCRCGRNGGVGNLNVEVNMSEFQPTAGRARLVRALDAAAASGMSELPLHALAGIVSR